MARKDPPNGVLRSCQDGSFSLRSTMTWTSKRLMLTLFISAICVIDLAFSDATESREFGWEQEGITDIQSLSGVQGFPSKTWTQHQAHHRNLQDATVQFDSGLPYTPCGVSGNYSVVGFRGNLSSTGANSDLQINATLTIFDDCYFALSDVQVLAEAGSAPATGALGGISFWTGPPAADPADLAPINPQADPIAVPLQQPFLVVYLQGGGLTWAGVQVIYLCTTAQDGTVQVVAEIELPTASQLESADAEPVVMIRQAALAAAAAQGLLMPPPPAVSSPPPPPQPGSSGPSAGLLNCIEAVPGQLNVYWSVKGQAIEYGLEAKLGDNSWIGFGVSGNQSVFDMLNSDVTIAGVAAPGEPGFAVDYFITAREPCQAVAGGHAGVCPDSVLGGSSALNNVALKFAARKGDVTFVRFTKAASTGDSLYDVTLQAGPLWAIFATGPLAPGSDSRSPGILYHDPAEGYLSGGTRIDLQADSLIFACPAPLWGSQPTVHPTLPPYVPPPPPKAPSAPQTQIGRIGERSACQVTVKGQTWDFPSCAALPGGFVIMWSLTGLSLTAAFSSQQADLGAGYMAVGISPDGVLPKSSLLVVRQQGQESFGVDQYYAGGWQPYQLVPGGNLTVTDIQVDHVDGTVLLLFNLLLQPSEPAACYIVWTKGSKANGTLLSADGILGYYTSAISFKTSDSMSPNGNAGAGYQWAVHGVLATLAWAVLVPLGVASARYLRKLHPYWFLFHQTFQLLAYALILMAFILGWGLPTSNHSATLHGSLGIIIMILTTIQISAFFWRPGEDSKHRGWWRTCHAIQGGLVLVLALAQIFIGLQLSDSSSILTIAFVIYLILLALAFAVLELLYGNVLKAFTSCRVPPMPDLCGAGCARADDSDAQSTDSWRPLFKRSSKSQQSSRNLGKEDETVTSTESQGKAPDSEPPAGVPQSQEPSSPVPSAFQVQSAAAGADQPQQGNPGYSAAKPVLKRSWSVSLRSGELKNFGENPVVCADKFNVKATMVREPDFLPNRGGNSNHTEAK